MDLEKIKKGKSTQELLEFGIINIDKSSGPTSFNISDFVRKKLNLRKTSHFGTLDPKVTGVLPVALNRACKLTGFFLALTFWPFVIFTFYVIKAGFFFD